MLSSGVGLKGLYLIGEIPFNHRPPSGFLIFQNIYPSEPSFEADLVLPSAAFSEVDGTFINGEGRIQRVRKAVDPPDGALPDWEIICRIARKMGAGGFEFSDVREVHEEISCLVRGFGDIDNTERDAEPLVFEGKLAVSKRKSLKKAADDEFPFLLNLSIDEHTYLGFPLSSWVEGAGKLFPVGTIEINPEDAIEAGISQGDEVIVTSADFEEVWPVRIVSDQPRGTLRVRMPNGGSVEHNQHPVKMRKKDV
jgi:predicted molibdopterin-dependent oxidoreductase YjgC